MPHRGRSQELCVVLASVALSLKWLAKASGLKLEMNSKRALGLVVLLFMLGRISAAQNRFYRGLCPKSYGAVHSC